ncbi:hypothetical protein D1BOALGB6SA_7705 [Olavius sp. associated proteobacterium Delta 1]|nr:hypothetical protein D1BOALGB6SA_7705 [Olavius sp. associated proteobacterium Delta 1]
MPKTVLVISTLNTKQPETLYLKDKIKACGLQPLLMDISMRGTIASLADITPDRVAAAGGGNFDEIRNSKDRTQITNITIAGASKIAKQLQAEGKIHGVTGMGGATGTFMITEVMRTLPFGVPKLMISSAAALPGLSTRYIGTGDITLFHSVIELSGLSDLLKNVFDRAAHAIAGMILGEMTPPNTGKGKAIAMTMLGPCDKCANGVQNALQESGYQVIGFHAAGICDRAMEEMISLEMFQGIIDLAPGGVGEHLFGFMRDSGPNRLESAGKVGIPQIISTCSVNHITPSKSKYTSEHRQRRKYDLDNLRTWLRISPDELNKVANAFAEKLNRARSPVRILIPLKGWSSADLPGNPTYDPAEDRLFTEVLRKKLKTDLQIVEVDANMEDPEFAQAVVENALKIF